MPVILGLSGLRQEDCQFAASLGCIARRKQNKRLDSKLKVELAGFRVDVE